MPSPVASLRSSLRRLLLAALATGLAFPAAAIDWSAPAQGAPLLRVFSAREIGTLAPYQATLWTRDGRLYVAHDGVSVFDGETWESLPIPEKTTVRALAEDQEGRVWVGGENLLGFLAWEADRSAVFHSAKSQLPPEYQKDLGSISRIFPCAAHQIVAVSENHVFRLCPEGPQVWSLPTSHRLIAWRDATGAPIIAQSGTATLRMTAAGLDPAPFPEPLASSGVEWAVEFSGDITVLGTGPQAFQLESGTATPITGALADLLREDRVTEALCLDHGYAALATLRHGVQIIDSRGTIVDALDRSSILPDAQVTHLSLSPAGLLTATTPDAVILLSESLEASLFDSRHGLPAQKRVAAFVHTTEGLFAAAGRKVLRLQPAPSPSSSGIWQLVAQTRDPLFDLEAVGNTIIGGTVDSLCSVSGPDVHTLRDSEIIAVGPWSGAPGGLAWIEGTRFFRGVLADGRLTPCSAPVEIGQDASSIVEDREGDHWVATTRSSVLRIAAVDQIAAGKPPVRKYREGLRATSSFRAQIFHVGPRILVTTEDGAAIYCESGDRFFPLHEIAGAHIHAICPTPDNAAWVALSQHDRFPFQVDLVRLRPEGKGIACDLATLPQLPLEEPPAALFVEPGPQPDQPVLWLGLNGRIVRVEARPTSTAAPCPPTIAARAIARDNRTTHVLAPHTSHVAFDNAGVRFDIHLPGGRLGQRAHLETRLVGFEPDWVPLGEIPSRVFRGLRDGTYRFEARTIDTIGRPSSVASLEFSVLPPWWRSAWAYVAYAFALVLVSGLVFLTRLRLARAHRRELEELVAQRTRELATANSAKSAFLAHINHEIRNPLNGVIGLSTMLAKHHHDDQTRQLARSLKACAGYLGSVVDNVLDLARIEAGRIEITPQQFDPRNLVEDIAEMFRLQVEEGSGRITWSADPDLPTALVGDLHRIRQVLVNFTANAARYARGSDVRITIRIRNRTPERIIVVFTVADTGPGIAPDEQSRIFEKFARGSSASGEEAPRGYGIGLALVRDLASLLGGEADVDSQPGFGAKFRLTIPLEIPKAARASTATAPEPASTNTLRVLVIDDQAFNRLILRDQLERLGCRVEESADGPSAFLLLQARAHHLAIIDLDLPGLDGFALMRRVRAEQPDNPVYLVATTASATRGIEDQAKAAGAGAFIPKPIAPAQLCALVRECSRRHFQDQPARESAATAPATAVPATASAGLFAGLPLTPDLLHSLHAELDVETQSLTASWRQIDRSATRRHAHRLASLGIIARDTDLLQAARDAEAALQSDRPLASQAVDTLQRAARARLRILATTVAATGQDAKN